MIVSPYRTTVTAAMQDEGKRIPPSTTNGRGKTKEAREGKVKSDA